MINHNLVKSSYFLQERHNEYHVTIQLRNCVAQHKQKVYMFECLELDEVASAIEYHAPRLAGWVMSGRQWKSNKVSHRLSLIESSNKLYRKYPWHFNCIYFCRKIRTFFVVFYRQFVLQFTVC